jgi:hypothetical protein
MTLTAHEIIDETVEYYQNNPRSQSEDGNSCLYNGPNGEKCAFSRCCTPDSKFKEGRGSRLQLNAILLPQYEGQSKRFWDEIQNLHDTDNHWDGNTLSMYGQKEVLRMKNEYL